MTIKSNGTNEPDNFYQLSLKTITTHLVLCGSVMWILYSSPEDANSPLHNKIKVYSNTQQAQLLGYINIRGLSNTVQCSVDKVYYYDCVSGLPITIPH